MKPASTATFASISLMLLCGFCVASHAQSACKAVDDSPSAFSARSALEGQGATPEALAAFRQLSLNPPRTRIVGGQLTLIADNPWQVALIRSAVPEPTRSQFCGGSIIRNEWILTAGHCVRNAIVREDPTRLEVIAGSSNTPSAESGSRLRPCTPTPTTIKQRWTMILPCCAFRLR